MNQIKQHASDEHKLVLKYINLERPLEDIVKQLTTNENMEEVIKCGKKRKEAEHIELGKHEVFISKEKEESEANVIKKMKEDFSNTTKIMKDSFKSQIANVKEVVEKTQEQMNELAIRIKRN